MKTIYTTRSALNGTCNHKHNSLESAVKCACKHGRHVETYIPRVFFAEELELMVNIGRVETVTHRATGRVYSRLYV